jgi:hypothetical protein
MPIKLLSQFWRADWHLSFLLGLLLVLVFILYPMSDGGSIDGGSIVGVTLQVFFSLILLSGVSMIASGHTLRLLAAALALGTAAVGWVRVYAPSERLAIVGIAMWMVFFAMLAVMVLARAFSEGPINFHRIQGAVAVYLLLGVIWAGAYRLIIHFAPAAFSPVPVGDEATLMSRLVYFSFVTLTTVGYGDVTAVHAAARSLALLEALAGQLFPAVLIARLVSLEVSNRESKRRGAAGD